MNMSSKLLSQKKRGIILVSLYSYGYPICKNSYIQKIVFLM
jgi:hypothetical protein